jgi:hypothetical protein
MVDVDLSKSLHMDSSGYVLRPTARIENTAEVGTIAGQVNADVLSGAGGTTFVGGTLETGCVVYAYDGHDVTPDDHYDGSPVVAAARVLYSETTGEYHYAIGALPGGTESTPAPYTVALTCGADDPLVDEDASIVALTGTQNVDVVIGQTASADFAP